MRSWNEAGRCYQKALNSAKAGRIEVVFKPLNWSKVKTCINQQRIKQLICRLGNANCCVERRRVKIVGVKTQTWCNQEQRIFELLNHIKTEVKVFRESNNNKSWTDWNEQRWNTY